MLLILAEPGLLGLAEHAPGEEVDDEPEDDADEGDGVQVVDDVAEDLDADDGAPEVAREQRDVEEGGRRDAQQEGHDGVEEEQRDGEPGEVPAHLPVPRRLLEALPVEDRRLHPVDEHPEQPQEREHLVHGPLADEPLLERVGQAVAGGAEEGEQVALQHVLGVVVVDALEVVTGEQDTHTTAGDQDSQNLKQLVPHAQQQEG